MAELPPAACYLLPATFRLLPVDCRLLSATLWIYCPQVALLFSVLLRHLQRFTVKTCHRWDTVSLLAATVTTPFVIIGSH